MGKVQIPDVKQIVPIDGYTMQAKLNHNPTEFESIKSAITPALLNRPLA